MYPYLVKADGAWARFSTEDEALDYCKRFAKGEAKIFVEEGYESPFPQEERPPRNLLVTY